MILGFASAPVEIVGFQLKVIAAAERCDGFQGPLGPWPAEPFFFKPTPLIDDPPPKPNNP